MRPDNEWFQPEQLRRLYFAYAGIAGLVALAPVVFFAVVASPTVTAVAGGLWLVVFGFLAWWVPTFAATAAYRLTDDDVEYRRGVWFRKHSDVPYDRITNVDTVQGPVQRFVGVGAVSLHTAGYASQTGAELTVTGIADYEDVKEQVLARVRGTEAPVGGVGASATTDSTSGTVGPATADRSVVEELRAIRELLEAELVE